MKHDRSSSRPAATVAGGVRGAASLPALTILTPTFNRCHLLPRLHGSILAQNVAPGRVEWLVVDDGSTDATAGWLAARAAEGPLPLRHVSTVNGGKHRALNRGAELARADWAMLVDSDDWLLDGALCHALELIGRFGADPRIGSLVSPLQITGRPQNRFALTRNPCSQAERLRVERHFDTCTIRRVAAMRAAPFPEIPGETFLAESWQHFAVSRTYLTHLDNTPLVAGEYQPDGLSARSLRLRRAAPLGAMRVCDEMLASNLPLRHRLRARINRARFWWHARDQGKRPAQSPGVIAAALALPLYLRDRWALRRG